MKTDAGVQGKIDSFYQSLSKFSKTGKGRSKVEKNADEYAKYIEKSALDLYIKFQSQGHSPQTAYYTLLKLVGLFYQSFGMMNPHVYLPSLEEQLKTNPTQEREIEK